MLWHWPFMIQLFKYSFKGGETILDKAFRDISSKDSRGYGVVGAGSAGVPRYQDYNVGMLTDEGYRKNVIVSACIQMIATSAPEAPLKVYKDTDKGLMEDENHWLSKLLQQPNENQSSFELWEYGHTYLNTGGRMIFELIRAGGPGGEVVEIYPLRPDRIRVVPGVDSPVSHYEYWVDGKKIIYEPWEILEIKFPDPLDEFNGLSPIKRVSRELGIDNEATDFTSTFFENAAVPYGLLTTEQNLGEPEADRIRFRWQRWFKGARRFMVAVLGKGMKYERMGLSFQEMEFEQLRSFTETRLCAAFGVDPVLLPSWVGIKHGGKYSNYAEARKHLWEETIIPTLRRIESKITSQLLEEGVVAKFDLSEVQAMQEDENEKAERVSGLYEKGILMLNEARTEMNVDPVPEGDKFVYEIVNSNKPNKENENNSEENDDQEDDSNDNNNNNGNDPNDDQDQKQLKKKNLITTKGIKDKLKNAFNAAMIALFNLLEDDFQKFMKQYFKSSKLDVLKLFEEEDGDLSRVSDRLGQLAFKWDQGLEDDSKPLFKKAIARGGQLATKLVNNALNNPENDFSMQKPDVIEFLETYPFKFAQKINKKTVEDLRKVLIKAQQEKWSITKVKDEIKHIFNTYSDFRIEMIARSEMIRSSNAGAMMAYKRQGIEEIEWLDTDDERTCIFCNHLDGQRRPIGKAFLALGEVLEVEDEEGNLKRYKNNYETVMYPPLHPNCRCTVIPVIN